jgi:hypothetical protein
MLDRARGHIPQPDRVVSGARGEATVEKHAQRGNRSLFASPNSAGKRFGEARDRGGVLATPADSGRQRPRWPAPRAAKPRKVKDYFSGARKPDLRRTAWWWRHSAATGLQPEFPDNRENNREFLKFAPFWAILAPNRRASSDGYNKIPCATEQGIILAEQGMFLREQGISAGQQGSGIDQPIFKRAETVVGARGTRSSVREPEHLVLARPRDRGVEQAGDADPVRQPTFDGGLDEARCQEGQRDRHVDVALAAGLS